MTRTGAFDGDTTEVMAGATTLMRQAPMTIVTYLDDVIEKLDSRFGEGYAALHPEMVATLVSACARDFHTGYVKLGMQEIRDALTALAEAVSSAPAHCSNCCPEDER